MQRSVATNVKPIGVALALGALALAIVLDPVAGERPRLRQGVEPLGGAADQPGPARRQHRPVRVRQPRRHEHGHDHRQLHPARGSGQRAELPQLRRQRPVRDQDRQHRRRRGRPRATSSGSTRRRGTRTRSSTTTGPIALAQRSELEPAADLRRHARHVQARTASPGRAKNGPVQLGSSTIPTPPDNIGPRSTPNYDALAAAAVTSLPGGDQGLRRPARRSVLRRPRLDLRPRRAPPVQPVPPDPARRGAGRGRAARTTTRTRSRSRSRSSQLVQAPTHDDRDLREREPAEADACSTTTARTTATGPWVQVSRLGNPLINEVADPARAEGLLEPRGAGGRLAVREPLHDAPRSPASMNLLYGAPPAGHPGGALAADRRRPAGPTCRCSC